MKKKTKQKAKTKKLSNKQLATEHPASVEAMNAQEVMTELLFEIATLSVQTDQKDSYSLESE